MGVLSNRIHRACASSQRPRLDFSSPKRSTAHAPTVLYDEPPVRVRAAVLVPSSCCHAGCASVSPPRSQTKDQKKAPQVRVGEGTFEARGVAVSTGTTADRIRAHGGSETGWCIGGALVLGLSGRAEGLAPVVERIHRAPVRIVWFGGMT